MTGRLDDIEFLARSEHRVAVLEALAEGPRRRSALREATGASSSTVGRILGDFEERRWVSRDGAEYALTPLGAFVEERFGALLDGMAIERRLRDVWRWLPRSMEGFSVDLFADAVVSYPSAGYPYEPVDRVTALVEGTATMRGFGTTVFKSGNLRAMCEGVLDGLELEYLYAPEVLESVLAWDPELAAEAIARPNCTVRLHDDLPDSERCGLCLFDDRVGICCHDADTGQLRAVVDTDAPDARRWAESVYERHREASRPLDEARLETASDAVA